jgi:hypothetical protein
MPGPGGMVMHAEINIGTSLSNHSIYAQPGTFSPGATVPRRSPGNARRLSI